MALQVRTQFGDLYLADALPAIAEVFQNEYDQYNPVGPAIFKMKGSNRSIEQTTGLTGFGRFVETPEGQPYNSDLAYQRFDKTFTHLKYTLGFKTTEELIDDDEFGIVEGFSRELAKSAQDTREIHAASQFNEAFSATNFTGGDGIELCATNHPLVAGTEQNELTTSADLSVTSLRQALQDIADTTNDRGLLINLRAKYLLVPNELEWDAIELLKSNMRPDTANNATNAFSSRNLEPMVWNYLTDADAWFLVCDKNQHDLTWWDRKPLTLYSEEYGSSGSMATYAKMRYSFGWNDWRGIFGSPGA